MFDDRTTNRCGGLPVVEAGRLLGMLSQADIALEATERLTGEVCWRSWQPTGA